MSVQGVKREIRILPNLVRVEPTGVYYFRGRVQGKLKRESLHTKSLRVAKARLQDKLGQVEAAKSFLDQSKIAALKAPANLAELVEEWLRREARETGRPQQTVAFRQGAAKRLWAAWPRCFGEAMRDVRPERVSRRDMQMLLDYLRTRGRDGQPYAPQSIKGVFMVLRELFEIGLELGVCAVNPASGLKMPKQGRKRLELPEGEAVERLVAALRARSTARHPQIARPAMMAELMLYTGMRQGEAAALRWEDVLDARGLIRVPGSKTAAAERLVPLGERAADVLDRVAARWGRAGGELVFARCRDIGKTLDGACAEAGVPRLTSHGLRKLFITTACEAGVPPTTVARWVGHVDLKLIMRVYTALRETHSRAEMDRLAFPGTPKRDAV